MRPWFSASDKKSSGHLSAFTLSAHCDLMVFRAPDRFTLYLKRFMFFMQKKPDRFMESAKLSCQRLKPSPRLAKLSRSNLSVQAEGGRTLTSPRVPCFSEQMQSRAPLAAPLNAAISFNSSSFADLNELFLSRPHAGEYWTLPPASC